MNDDQGKISKAPSSEKDDDAKPSRPVWLKLESREKKILGASLTVVGLIAGVATLIGLYVHSTEKVLPYSLITIIVAIVIIILINRGIRHKVRLSLLALVAGLVCAAVLGAVVGGIIGHSLKTTKHAAAASSSSGRTGRQSVSGSASPGTNLTGGSKIVAVLTDPASQGVRGVAFTFDHKYLAAADSNGNTYVWATPADTLNYTLMAPASRGVNAVTFSPDGKLATGDRNGHVYLWSGTSYKQLTDPASRGVTAVAFTPNSDYLAAADGNGSTYIWNVATLKTVAVLADPGSKGIQSVAFTPNGKYLAAGGANGHTYIWDVSNTGS